MRTWMWTSMLAMGFSLLACGGAKREAAKDPSDTPAPSSSDDTPKWEGANPPPSNGSPAHPSSSSSSSSPSSAGSQGSSSDPPQQHRGDQYDKEATEVVLKRA